MPLSSQQGFSLIEVMVAMVILAVGILSIVGIQYHVVNGNTRGNVMTEQINLAQRVLERYKNTVNVDKLGNEDMVGVDETGAPGGPYTVRVRVEHMPGVKETDAQKITLTVTKSGGIGARPAGSELKVVTLTRGHGI
ncbi:MAG: prepilin-type N-terminal cleavage/methylation domain-containing protein [Desulfobulbus oligotrophicus]|jgi:type IV pilus assembly protein PilV|nr:prepilin-type N-terminal cleavage/methylation domain-containing protein [Desulfobulbus oligotrophicus]